MSAKIVSGTAEPSRTAPAARLLRATPLVVILLVGGLVAWFLLSLHPTPSQIEPTMHPTATVDGRRVRVTVTTDLPNGAVVNYFYVHVVGSLQGQEPDGGFVTVDDGRFDFASDFSGRPGGAITLYVEFAVGSGWDQPQAVIDRFGADGERISGPQAISDSGDPPHLFATTTFVLPAR